MSDHCNSCGASITWERNSKGHRVPRDADGTDHRKSCPQRTRHHKSARTRQDGERRGRTKR
jgi:hypothetical protein